MVCYQWPPTAGVWRGRAAPAGSPGAATLAVVAAVGSALNLSKARFYTVFDDNTTIAKLKCFIEKSVIICKRTMNLSMGKMIV